MSDTPKTSVAAEEIFLKAQAEIRDERTKDLTNKLKAKLRSRALAQAVVVGLDNEIAAMKLEIEDAVRTL
jgi:hypothetical protein